MNGDANVPRTTTPRQRVLDALGFHQPDRTPMDFGGTTLSSCEAPFLAAMRQRLGYRLPDDRDEDGWWVDETIQKFLGVDLRCVPPTPPLVVLKDLDPAAYEKQRKARQEKPAQLLHDVKTRDLRTHFPMAGATLEDVKRLRPQKVEPPRYLNWMIRVARDYQTAGYATTYAVDCGFFESACWQRGYDRTAMDLAEQPDLLRTLFDVWLVEKLERIEVTARPLAPYIDIFCFGDDLGMQTGPFMSPQMFRTIIKPYMKQMYAALKRVAPKARVFHHSCGSVYRLLDDLMEAGVELLNPCQPHAADMSPENLKAKGDGWLAFHGGIDLQRLLPFGTPEEVKAEAQRVISILGRGGGYICAAAHSLPDDVPVENILALFSLTRQ